ncbi:uncharacterized protein PFL1_04470 [Pseudozyma flocculosa PF-1]|uniref:Protein BTN n=1 Tax=Pseudozyma flocculosa PF-1 TaxID=1277687 RepID=A0A061H694_9BASI|nr:uncharacterized protein PFL1_04470 [Pseudozyma flocculosa PF-1]EPQ28143.1 hypothetical protein PFL1_04470 [Pseudozyma flocculosa PF-1]
MWRTASASSPSAADGPPGRDHHHYHHRRPVAFLEPKPPISVRLNAAFFLFGLLNNSLYVVILTAALELLPQGVPTGLVSLANILPALVAKAVWPYVLKGTVRYTKRIWACAGLSFVGMMVISMFPSLVMRLLGISLASFSSGLGELTFLQLSTRYAPKPAAARGRSRRGVPTISQGNYAGDGVGWFASGTGAAGLVGAAAWWIVRPLGVQTGGHDDDGDGDDADAAPRVDEHGRLVSSDRRSLEVVPEPVADSATGAHILLAPAADDGKEGARAIKVRLSFAEKMELLRPMLWPYILPLVTVYFSEYTINQGVAPTLIYPLPTRAQHPLLSRIIRKLSDYYPLYQLVYQTFVFISRSSVSILRLPAIPKRFLWLPAILQTALLLVLASESLHAWFRPSIASPLVIVLICIEGLAGGGAYVSVFYSIGLNEERAASVRLPDGDDDDEEDAADPDHPKAAYEAARRAQEHEFRIGCVGFGDSLGILVASLVSMPLQVDLCNRQVASGRSLCKQV